MRNHDLVIECGGVDGLVHNASIFRAAAFDGNVKEIRKEIDDHIDIHFKAPFIMTQALLQPLQAKQGSVVAITDMSFEEHGRT